jgi:diadenosine tetraphosphate (Ap4A) HIT family hydrolase
MGTAMECYSCLANAGQRRISPGPVIYEGEHWKVDHAYPTKLVGWLVLVLKRHAEALHELSAAECAEMGALLGRAARALREETGCEKEYLACFAEADHFHHVHIHVVARRADLPHELQGPRSFALLNPAPEDAASAEDVTAFCQRMQAHFAQA